MNNRTHIHNELQTIAPGLVSLPVAMPYTLPPQYFEGLAAELLSIINGKPEHYPSFSKNNPYTIPTGYFENLPEMLLQRVKSESFQGAETDFLSTLPKVEIYTVPTGYFSEFPAIMLQKVKGEKLQEAIPAGYFESLPEKMLAKVRKLDAARELDEVAPLLNTISRQPVQYVPTGYFETLHPIMGGVEQEKPVVLMKKSSNWLRYAVAASVIFLLAFGAYFLFSTHSNPVPSIANQPTTSAINEQLAKLDASTIENYLKTNNAIQVSSSGTGIEEPDITDLDDVLKGFTDQDLRKHIDETPELPIVSNLHT